MAPRTVDRVTVRSPVALSHAVLDEIARRLGAAMHAKVEVTSRIDKRVHGAVIVLDEGRQIRVDPAMPFSELQRQLAGVAREVAAEAAEAAETAEGAATAGPEAAGNGRMLELARETILGFEPSGVASVGATNLARVLSDFRGGHVTLLSRVEMRPDVVARLREKLEAAAGTEIALAVRVDPRLEDGAVLMLGDDRRIVLDGRRQWVGQIERAVARAREGIEVPGDPSELIREMIHSTEAELEVQELLDTGTVLEVGDGVARCSGMRGVGSQELVEFEGGVYGMAFSLNRGEVGCILLGPEEGLREGSRVTRTGHLLRVPAGDGLLGRIVNSLGQPIDGKGILDIATYLPAERIAPGVVDRQPVEVPLHTGWKVVDALVPLGRGQRELIIGDRKIGKTTVAVDAILSQKNTGVLCVYAAIGQKASSVANVVRVLEQNGAMEYTIVVASLPGEQPAFRHLTPYTACAMGEYFMESGRDALVVYDDLSKHAVTYREMSALLERPIGREAYPGDIFYLHSRLLERAAHLSDELGGGSLTALPIVETQASDISAFIPTNVISICDGQIFLDTDLFNEGFRPALDVGLSVSRVGGSAQTKPMKRVAGRLRIDLAQYHEMAQFVKFGAEVDSSTQIQLARGERSRELLKQAAHEPLSAGLQVASLFAATAGFLDNVDPDKVERFEEQLHERLMTVAPGLVERLGAPEELDEATSAELARVISEFNEEYWRRRNGG